MQLLTIVENQDSRKLLGLSLLPLYLLLTIFVGWISRGKAFSANAFLSATHSLSLPIVVVAYLAANCGALEIVGLSALAAQYGIQAVHFYLIGAIPAMVFLALWMMPIYRSSGITSVPQYLSIRYGPNVRLLYACIQALTVLLLAGISLYAMAQVLQTVFGWSFVASIISSAGVVLLYTLMGGVRATIYNEVLQLAVIVGGLAPLAIFAWRSANLLHDRNANFYDHLWTFLPTVSKSAPLDRLGVIAGLGFILSFGYWCTDFVLMQRAFMAKSETDARMVPLWAGFGKIIFAGLVVIPGLAAHRMLPELGRGMRFDDALPALMKSMYGPTMLGLGLTALAASLMSGLGANMSAFAAIFTEDIYRLYFRENAPDEHYLRVGKWSLVLAACVCTAASYMTFYFSNLMEHVQLIFSIFAAPFWAIFLLGITSRYVSARGAFTGFLSGVGVAILQLLAITRGITHYGSMMNANFHVAIHSFTSTIAVALVISTFEKKIIGTSAIYRPANVLQLSFPATHHKTMLAISGLLLTLCAFLNWWLR